MTNNHRMVGEIVNVEKHSISVSIMIISHHTGADVQARAGCRMGAKPGDESTHTDAFVRIAGMGLH
jgi:hypothetical protein